MVRLAQTAIPDGGVDSALRYVRQVADALPGVEAVMHEGIGAAWEFRTNTGELGHVHADGVLHVRLSRAERDLVVHAGLAAGLPHDDDKQWVEFRMRSASDAYAAAALLERSLRYLRRTTAREAEVLVS
jgi:hypothetical protein